MHRRLLRLRAAQLLHPLARGRDGHEIRLGEVAVVLRVLLGAARRGDAGVFVEVARLLHHPTAGLQDPCLPLDLRAHRSLDRAQGVDVLGLRARAPRIARQVEREVGVAAQRPFLHLDVGDAEAAHDVAQLRDVGACHLGG